MNCKPGDLALIIRDAKEFKFAGMLVQVLYLAPVGRIFQLPDAKLHDPVPTMDIWVVEFPHLVDCPLNTGKTAPSRYGCIIDRVLRPLPDPESLDAEEIDQQLPERAGA